MNRNGSSLVNESDAPRRRARGSALWAGGAAVAALLILAGPRAARAQDEGDRSDDGNWSGDEGGGQGNGRHRGERRNGYAPRDEDEGDGSGQGDEGDNSDYSAPASGPSMGEFRDSLSPYGEWIDTPEYGSVWRPSAVDDGWRPYYQGHWAWTDAGWYWVADEPYGWAVYHYGRWANLDGIGWSWLPGQVWAPAWVAFRWGDGYAGWCPLGPQGYVYQQPADYVIVQQQYFLSPAPHYAVPIAQGARFFGGTHAMPVGRPGPQAGPVVHAVAQATGHPVRLMPVVDTNSPTRRAGGAVAGGVVYAYRPRSVPLGHPQSRGSFGQVQPRSSGSPEWSEPHESSPASIARGGRAGQHPAGINPYFGGVPVRGIIERNANRGGQPMPQQGGECGQQGGTIVHQGGQVRQGGPGVVQHATAPPAVSPPPPPHSKQIR